jgi:hypothetical protein
MQKYHFASPQLILCARSAISRTRNTVPHTQNTILHTRTAIPQTRIAGFHHARFLTVCINS